MSYRGRMTRFARGLAQARSNWQWVRKCGQVPRSWGTLKRTFRIEHVHRLEVLVDTDVLRSYNQPKNFLPPPGLAVRIADTTVRSCLWVTAASTPQVAVIPITSDPCDAWWAASLAHVWKMPTLAANPVQCTRYTPVRADSLLTIYG